MPIALVITDLDRGGAEKILVSLAKGLDRSRWLPSVVCLGGEGALAAELRAVNVPVHILNVNARRPIQSVARLARVFRKIKPRLVQSFLFHANVASRLAAKLAGSPPVIGGIRVAEHQKRWHLRLERLTQSLGLGWVCVSQGVKDFSIEQAHLDPLRLHVIRNGVDLSQSDAVRATERISLDVSHEAPLALFVGRLEEQKGVDILLDAAARLVDLPCPWRLLIVGEGSLRREVGRRLRQDGRLAERVRLFGRREDVPSLLKAADVLVLSSRWEGLPNVILEAMAAARPVIATQVEGTRELDYGGWRVASEDVAGLSEAMSEAFCNLPEARDRGKEGRLAAERKYSLASMVAAYEDLWSRVLSTESAATSGNKLGGLVNSEDAAPPMS
jgi:starch synthase (maltosyl-transferring)